jgi:Na+/melibiose symporter-like transporter
VLFAPVPIAALVIVLTPIAVSEDRTNIERTGVDIWGAITFTLSLALLLYGLSNVVETAWSSAATLVPLGLGVVLLVGLAAIERRTRAPLVPLSIVRIPCIAVPNVAIMLRSATGASTYVLSIYFQRALGRSPLEAGLALLPMAVAAAAAAPVTARLVKSLRGLKPTMMLGTVAQGVGLVMMGVLQGGAGVWIIVAGSVVWAIGKGFGDVAMTITATSSLEADLKGLGAGLVTTSQEVGRACGLGFVAAIASAHINGRLLERAIRRDWSKGSGGRSLPMWCSSSSLWYLSSARCRVGTRERRSTIPRRGSDQRARDRAVSRSGPIPTRTSSSEHSIAAS